jgi:hypothetical protein
MVQKALFFIVGLLMVGCMLFIVFQVGWGGVGIRVHVDDE